MNKLMDQPQIGFTDPSGDPLHEERVAPVTTSITAPFWEAAEAGQFVLQRCTQTGAHQFYPRPVSIATGRRTLEWVPVSGRGTIYSMTRTYRAPAPYKTRETYIVAVVDLEEGVRVMANVVGAAADDAVIGADVRLVWVKAGEGRFFAFELA